jgi:Tfp pilus assembly protein FimT
MLLVVGIMAIMTALVIPMFKDGDVSKLRGAASVLMADLAYAQVESIAHGEDPRLVVFDTATSSYKIATTLAPTTAITNPIDKQPYEVVFGSRGARELSGVTISSYSLGGDAVLQFGAYGELDQATAATITLGCNSKTITVTVDPTTGDTSVSGVQ